MRVKDFCFAIFRPPLSRSAFARTSFERSVRFMFTTRERAPRRDDALSPSRGVDASNVTTPPLCAPRIIVTYTIFSSTSNALRPFSEQHHAWFRSTIPKFPHSSCDAPRGTASNRSVLAASSAVSQNARRDAASGCADASFRGRAPTLSAASRACRRSATSASARLAAKPASRTNLNAPAHRVSNASGKRTWRPSTTLASVFSRKSARTPPCCSTGHAKLTAPKSETPPRTTKAYARTCASSCTHPASA